MREIIMPTLVGMAAEGLPTPASSHAGLMIDARGAPCVVEFNCRMGDPETQPIMMRLKTDLVDLVEAAIAGKLDKIEAELGDRRFPRRGGNGRRRLPGQPRKGDAIHGLPASARKTCTSSTPAPPRRTARSSPTVAACCASPPWATTCVAPRNSPTNKPDQIHFDGMQCRRDIGYRAVARKG